MKLLDENTIELLRNAAWTARSLAYAPYSGFRVGASIWLPERDEITCGVNVENASFGATICAERSALVQVQSRWGKSVIGAVLVATDAEEPAVPCALCLQVLAEFVVPSTPILLANHRGVVKRFTFSELLPHPFTSFVRNDK